MLQRLLAIIVGIFLMSSINSSSAANILAIFPTPSISHQVVFRAITDELENRGHTLTIVSTDPERLGRRHPNTTEIDMHFTYEFYKREFNFVKVKEAKLDELGMIDSWYPLIEPMYSEQFEHPEIQKLIQSRGKVKYDAVIVEFMFFYPWYAMAEWFDAPLIGMTSFDTFTENHESFGNFANPIAHPEIYFPFIENLTFKQRYLSLRYYFWYNYYYTPKFQKIVEKLINRYLPGTTTSLVELRNKAELLMTNTHPALGFIRPIVPTTIQLGFLHIKPPKPITDLTIRNYLDNSDKPIIYMSLGSNVRSSEVNQKFVNIFLNVFKFLPYNILWKWETDDMKNKPNNVFIHKWLPQADLLAHPNIKLFIMQGGQQSLEEAIDRGIPLIVIPFLGDQSANAQRVEKLKIGLHLDLHSLNEKILKETIDEVISGDYRKNILNLRDIVHDQPMKPVDKAVWWIEYFIRHKGMEHLNYTGKNVPFYQLYMLDFLAITLLGSFLMFKIISKMLKIVFSYRKNKLE
ncbi:CLUMA_CG010909, isoform A [Clunio marinus]|uniref:UDP-glucuronosyltransferase n=1 Tax=Clunio marinus TaxID=568069 RepID=A0A1J1IBB1_9DIPT|nr:CLUMA_CG010909, isoform A [Clunio marinus]